ncbi:MAG: hypothetical protein NTZ27_11340 [Ignavibacteriales bacterium]|nr:hypothetical protein [Ignavibacteriales bacterium]
MNQKQKRTLIVSAIIIVSSLILWIAFGGHLFTRTHVLVENKEVNKFIWGLNFSIVLSVVTIFIGSIVFFLFRDKKKN